MEDEKKSKIEEVLSGEEDKKPRAEQVLQILETELKSLIRQKKELKIKFQNKFKEIQQWFEEEWKEATKFENKMILLWDYYQREVEILSLQKQIQSQVLSTDRQENVKKLDKLIAMNAGLEKGFKVRKIDPKLMEELRKKIGAWE